MMINTEGQDAQLRVAIRTKVLAVAVTKLFFRWGLHMLTWSFIFPAMINRDNFHLISIREKGHSKYTFTLDNSSLYFILVEATPLFASVMHF